ncbi:hypothetical protein Bhyg_02139 [Pseudolycoriella hygida]|uniref:Uncharacterized protein n=1 Tax=Pseudolycoriella hygida TaxID=35572 RepID=A0A9Q0S836_9DIPT|nr:hypothetical protein Bhyg_02139 [Pseudolycoriella hygida]
MRNLKTTYKKKRTEFYSSGATNDAGNNPTLPVRARYPLNQPLSRFLCTKTMSPRFSSNSNSLFGGRWCACFVVGHDFIESTQAIRFKVTSHTDSAKLMLETNMKEKAKPTEHVLDATCEYVVCLMMRITDLVIFAMSASQWRYIISRKNTRLVRAIRTFKPTVLTSLRHKRATYVAGTLGITAVTFDELDLWLPSLRRDRVGFASVLFSPLDSVVGRVSISTEWLQQLKKLRVIARIRGLSVRYNVKTDLVQRIVSSLREEESIESLLEILREWQEGKEQQSHKKAESSSEEEEYFRATAICDNKLFVGLLGVVLDVELVLDGDEFGLDMVELDSVDEIGSICGVGGTERVDCANCDLQWIHFDESYRKDSNNIANTSLGPIMIDPSEDVDYSTFLKTLGDLFAVDAPTMDILFVMIWLLKFSTKSVFYLREFSSIRHLEVVRLFSYPQVHDIRDIEVFPEMIRSLLNTFGRMCVDMVEPWNLNSIAPNTQNTPTNRLKNMTNIVVCRLCLHDTDSFLDILSNNSQPSDIDKKILRYLGVQTTIRGNRTLKLFHSFIGNVKMNVRESHTCKMCKSASGKFSLTHTSSNSGNRKVAVVLAFICHNTSKARSALQPLIGLSPEENTVLSPLRYRPNPLRYQNHVATLPALYVLQFVQTINLLFS